MRAVPVSGWQRMPSPPSEETPSDGGDGPQPRRAVSPRAEAGQHGARKFVDFRMEAVPVWNRKQPEVKYKEYSGKASALAGGGCRATTHIAHRPTDPRRRPFPSRLVAQPGHLNVEEITHEKGARLEHAFDMAIFKGRRFDQTPSGVVATKRQQLVNLNVKASISWALRLEATF